MIKDQIDIRDIEAFIKGLKTSLDMLDGVDPAESKGFQAQLAKAISNLRVKRSEKLEHIPKILGHVTKEDIKKHLIKELDQLMNYLDSKKYPEGKFKLVKQIVDLRAEINSL
jgi:hypothetical protein